MLAILKQCLLRLFRSPSSIFFVLIFPSLLIFVLGNMLANLDNPDWTLGEIKLGYAAAAVDAPYEAAQQIFFDALADHEFIDLKRMDGQAAAERAVNSGEIDAALSLSLPDGITVYEGDDAVKNRAVGLIAQSFAREYAAAETVYASVGDDVDSRLHGDDKGGVVPDYGKEGASDSSLVESRTAEMSRSMLDYYAVAMIVMIAFIGGAISGAVTMYTDRMDGTLRRVLCSPKTRASVFVEYVLGALPQSILQTAVAMAVATVFFGAHYAQTAAQNLLLFGALTLVGFAVTTLFMVIGLAVRTNPYMPLMAILWVSLFLSGTFDKSIAVGGLTEHMPAYVIQSAAFDLTVFGREEKLLAVMGVCAVVAALSAVAGALLLNRKKVVS
ncbi:hypothetical protein AGMMS49983_05320 [Clostridia bacterium]|nr:hypothetical protein AGMMS49983_05320 [Clostridia bacterium]